MPRLHHLRRLRLSRLFKGSPWSRWLLAALGLAGFALAVWFGGPMTGWPPLASIFWRVTIIITVAALTLMIALIRWRRRLRAARAIEQALLPAAPEGDGNVLAERLAEALAVLKKSGGAASLYDLPWYVMIGPPGAGKTTALANSGIEFPLARNQPVAGYGGTRYADFWFSEDAVLIDTAGRYTTQDSDQTADSASWQAFLDLLKKSRPNRPINGVILSFSVEDMMGNDPQKLASHAATVRDRLAEIHEVLKVDFPVYVMFTKADLIAGFREYFASFSLNRRKLVWGVTFQTKDRKAITHESVPGEFDRLVRRLSDEVTDRMSEEPDGIARIAIFGLPGQMALLRDNVAEFLRRIFEPTRYKSNAILRGFYFTSGTQEGTPIDQVLGAMESDNAFPGLSTPFMSGHGKSYFIHDLLKRVIFPEQGWVSFDAAAVRRALMVRGTILTVTLILATGAMAALGFSFWNNRNLLARAQAETAAYARAAEAELTRETIDDPDLRPVLPLLDQLRALPAGYDDDQPRRWRDGLGLGQRDRLHRAALSSYSDGLERMLRPRLVLDLERRIPKIIQSGELTEIYRALKVYLLLGGQAEVKDDSTVLAWFRQSWRQDYDDHAGLAIREALDQHLQAMLDLDDDRNLMVTLDQTVVQAARDAISQLPLDVQAYALIQDGAVTRGLGDWQPAAALPHAAQVFRTRDDSPLETLRLSGLYTYEGFWGYFFDQLSIVKDELRRDQWVLGDLAGSAEIEGRLGRLEQDLLIRYRQDFIAAWQGLLDNLALAPMVADKPRYAALGVLAAAQNSPLLELVKEVDLQTNLMREIEGLGDLTPEMLAGGDGGGAEVAGQLGEAMFSRFKSRSGGVQRMLLDAADNQRRKSQSRPLQVGARQPEGNGLIDQIQQITDAFAGWHDLARGQPGQRPVDALIGNFGAVFNNLREAEHNPDQAAAALPTLLNSLTQFNSQLPDPLVRLILDAEGDFRSGATDASLEVMNRALTNRITFFCRENIAPAYPFGNTGRSLSLDSFAQFFGPGGEMDRYFTEYLEPYVQRSEQGLRYREDKPITARFDPNTLRQFERAEQIRRAFFAGGGTSPAIEITVAQVDAHSSIDSALLTINDEMIPTVTGAMPRTINWPGTGRSTMLQISPAMDRPSRLEFEGSSWTFMQFLQAAASRQQRGDTLRAVFNLGGRSITYDFTINAPSNPFTMPEIRDFACPASIN